MASSEISSRNFEKGMLIDDEWMGGISKELEGFSAFVLDHQSGSVLAQQRFPDLQQAIDALNRIPRPWRFEATAGCSGDRCAEGQCKGSGCKIFTGSNTSPSSNRAPGSVCES